MARLRLVPVVGVFVAAALRGVDFGVLAVFFTPLPVTDFLSEPMCSEMALGVGS